MKKHLIMGFGTNQTRASLEVFLRSARAIYGPEECDVAIVTNTVEGVGDLFEETASTAIFTPSTYSPGTSKLSKALNRWFLHTLRLLDRAGLGRRAPEIHEGYYTLIETWHHPQLCRWFAYRRLLRFAHRYDKILLADIKDVVFQARFFDAVDEGEVQLFEDGEDFRAEGWNGRWYVEAYGAAEHAKVAGLSPICIGTVAGGAVPLAEMIATFCDEIARAPFGKIEQAIFNRMYRAGAFGGRVALVPNYAGIVATLAGPAVESETVLREGRIRAAGSGRLFPVVHMYDRFEATNAAVRAVHAEPPREAPPLGLRRAGH